MQNLTFEVGDVPRIEIGSIGGDLRLSGRDEGLIELKAPSDAELSIEQDGDHLQVSCPSDCLMFLPRNSILEVGSVGGDMRATNIVGRMAIRTVGGDLSLRSHNETVIETVGGDFHARNGSELLSVDQVGGDALIDRISGNVVIRSIGGDLKLRRVDGTVEVMAGGDSSLVFTTLGEGSVKAQTGGDLFCSLPPSASAEVRTSSGGSTHAPQDLPSETVEGVLVFTLGEGDTSVELIAGGDLWFQSDEASDAAMFVSLGDSIASQVESQLEAGIAKMEAKLEAIGAGMDAFPSERIGEQVRRAVTRARRNANRTQRKVNRIRVARRGTVQAGSESSGATEDERLSILQMLEKGIITVEEAEKLIQTLEGGE